MIGAMCSLALDYLMQQVGDTEKIPNDKKWYKSLRENEPAKLFSYLVEDVGKIEKVYIIEPLPDLTQTRLTVQDLQANSVDNLNAKLPFMKPSGSQSAQIGPVIKRTFSRGGAGPSDKILNTTVKSFVEIAKGSKPWALYFQGIMEVLGRKYLQLPDWSIVDWQEQGYGNMLSCKRLLILLHPPLL